MKGRSSGLVTFLYPLGLHPLVDSQESLQLALPFALFVRCFGNHYVQMQPVSIGVHNGCGRIQFFHLHFRFRSSHNEKTPTVLSQWGFFLNHQLTCVSVKLERVAEANAVLVTSDGRGLVKRLTANRCTLWLGLVGSRSGQRAAGVGGAKHVGALASSGTSSWNADQTVVRLNIGQGSAETRHDFVAGEANGVDADAGHDIGGVIQAVWHG